MPNPYPLIDDTRSEAESSMEGLLDNTNWKDLVDSYMLSRGWKEEVGTGSATF